MRPVFSLFFCVRLSLKVKNYNSRALAYGGGLGGGGPLVPPIFFSKLVFQLFYFKLKSCRNQIRKEVGGTNGPPYLQRQ